MASFHYRQIDRKLCSDLSARALQGHGAVLHGPRFIGKRYVLDGLRVELRAAGLERIVELRVERGTDDDVTGLKVAGFPTERVFPTSGDAAHLLRELDQFMAESGRSVLARVYRVSFENTSSITT